MKITVLGSGTSQGVPVIACDCEVCISENPKDARLRSSVMIEEDGQTFVIDTGPDFRQQMLREKVEKVDAIIYTHEHKDHVAGMDDVRAYNYKWKKDVEIYCTQRVNEALHREFPYVFSDYRYPGVPSVNINIIENKEFEINGVKILPIEAMHYKLPIFGFRIKNFVYLTDVSSISEKEKEKMKSQCAPSSRSRLPNSWHRCTNRAGIHLRRRNWSANRRSPRPPQKSRTSALPNGIPYPQLSRTATTRKTGIIFSS